MILVTGATGNAGRAVVRALVAAGIDVRAPAIWTSRSPVGTALDGVRGVFLLSGFRNMPGVLAEIRRAGAQQVVPAVQQRGSRW